MYIEKELKEYLHDLAAKKSAPGGGSAAAMAAAIGAALVSMVANFTLGKEKYKQIEPKMRDLLAKSENLRLALMKLVDADVTAYRKLSDLYKKSVDKDSPAVGAALKEAVSVPLEVCYLSMDVIRLCPLLVKEGNVNLVSDIGVVLYLLNAAFLSAKIFVDTNIKDIKDQDFIDEIGETLASLEQEIGVLKAELLTQVHSRLKGE